jgi:hypothetical protein
MKSRALLPLLGLLWLLFVGARPATIDYSTIDDGICRFSFPTGYATNLEGDVAMYSKQIDNITFDVHRFYTGNVQSIAPTATATGPALPFQTRAATRTFQQQNDTFIQTLQQATGGTVVSQFSVTTNSKQGTEVEINYPEPGTDQTTKMYVRYYWNDSRMYTFSVSANTSNGSTLTTAKTTLFNSITFY